MNIFFRATAVNYHKYDGLNEWKSILSVLEARRPKSKCQQVLLQREPSKELLLCAGSPGLAA